MGKHDVHSNILMETYLHLLNINTLKTIVHPDI